MPNMDKLWTEPQSWRIQEQVVGKARENEGGIGHGGRIVAVPMVHGVLCSPELA